MTTVLNVNYKDYQQKASFLFQIHSTKNGNKGTSKLVVGSFIFEFMINLCFRLEQKVKTCTVPELLAKDVHETWKQTYLKWKDENEKGLAKHRKLGEKSIFHQQNELIAQRLYNKLPLDEKNRFVSLVQSYLECFPLTIGKEEPDIKIRNNNPAPNLTSMIAATKAGAVKAGVVKEGSSNPKDNSQSNPETVITKANPKGNSKAGSKDKPQQNKPQLSPEEKEKKRVDFYEHFYNLISEWDEYFFNEGLEIPENLPGIIREMNSYFELMGEYPYYSDYFACPPAFKLYLSNGLKPELYSDIARMIGRGIEEPEKFDWDTLKQFLITCGKDWKSFPHTRLIVNWIGEGGMRILTEAAEIGFVEYHIEHVVITMQRLFRYKLECRKEEIVNSESITAECRKESTINSESITAECRKEEIKQDNVESITSNSKQKDNSWLLNFEAKYHQWEPNWDKYEIHLRSLLISDINLDLDHEDQEIRLVKWNRKCIPNYLYHICRKEYSFREYVFSSGVEGIIGTEIWNAFVSNVQSKKEQLYSKNLEYFLEDDAFSKIQSLIRYQDSLDLTFHPGRDVLKYVSMELNKKENGHQYTVHGHNVTIDQFTTYSYLQRIKEVPFYLLEKILKILPQCLASYGRRILFDFSKLNLDSATEKDIHFFCKNILVGDYPEELFENIKTAKKYIKFIKFQVIKPELLHILRRELKKYQAHVRNGKNLFNVQVNSEPIKASSISLVSEKEAKLGK